MTKKYVITQIFQSLYNFISTLVYDYTKLDIGPEAEALLDQLKGRESQVRGL